MDPRDLSAARRTRLPDTLAAVRRALLRRRRVIAMLLLGVAVAASLRALAPPASPTSTLLVAARDLPAGATVAPGDLERLEVPPGVVPDGAVAAPEGRQLAAALRRGEPLTDVRLVGSGPATGLRGAVAAPVRLSDAGQAALLTVGDRVDLVATDPQTRRSEVLAHGVTVLAVPKQELGADGALPGRLVVLGLSPDAVQQITSASVTAFVTYVWAS